MPTALVSIEVVVGVVLVLLLAFIAGTYARRRAVSRGATLFVLSGWRPDSRQRWRLGHLRLGNARLEWYSLLGISTRPQQAWDRSRLELEAPRVPGRSERVDLIPDASPVPCAYGQDGFELALTPDAYTALRSWAEAAPPGSAANVA